MSPPCNLALDMAGLRAYAAPLALAADVLPANLLRFTITFSKPIRGGEQLFDRSMWT
jgi:hypothetical protein